MLRPLAAAIASLALLLVTAPIAVGCGAEPPRARLLPRVVARADAAPEDASPDAADAETLPAAARIAESATSSAPGMREAMRVEADAPFERAIVRAVEKDTCTRVAFAAGGPVDVAIADGKGAPLGETPRAASAISSTVCVRRGDSLVLRVTPAAVSIEGGAPTTLRVHAVAWIAP